jgi:Rrf2 family nitric oxide-sensitive transcriptional repressor
MQLNITTDYAIRALLFMVMCNRPVGASEISENMKIPHSYLLTIMAKLKKAGFVTSKRGQTGGYELAKPASSMRLWDVIDTMEGAPKLGRCLEDQQCSWTEVEECPIRKVYVVVQEGIESAFCDITIESLAKQAKDGL